MPENENISMSPTNSRSKAKSLIDSGGFPSMGTEHNCAGSSIYLMKSVDTDTDADTSRDIEDLLKLVDTLELDSDDDYSDVVDIFEEFHKDSFLRANADPCKKHLSKSEADWKTVERFTDDYKKTMAEVRAELEINRDLFDEEDEIEKLLTNTPTSNQSRILNRESPITIEEQKDELSETSSQSLVWQRLLNNSEGRFKVSPPVYDAFRQEEKHWLERPPISWKLVDDCRVKCDRWLDDVMQMGGE